MQLHSINTRVESAYGVCNQRLKLRYDNLLSSVAFDCNLRRCTAEQLVTLIMDLQSKIEKLEEENVTLKVRRCRLKAVNPGVEDAWFPALETELQ